jgi:hypothetical protein
MALVARQIGNLNEQTYEIMWTSPDGGTASKTWTVNNAYPSFVGSSNEVTQIEINDGFFYDTIMRVDPATGELILQSEEGGGRHAIQTASGRPNGEYRGNAAEDALTAINAGASLLTYAEGEAARKYAEGEAARRRDEENAARNFEAKANSYRPDINPFIRRRGGHVDGLEYANVNVEERSVQIIAQADFMEMLGDRAAAYFAARASDGKLTETFMQYSGGVGTISTRNFYELVTAPDGTKTATLHRFDPDTGEYTASHAEMADALASREDNLGAIRGDETIAFERGALRQKIQGLAPGITLDRVVFNSGEEVSPGQGFSKEALATIDRSIR